MSFDEKGQNGPPGRFNTRMQNSATRLHEHKTGLIGGVGAFNDKSNLLLAEVVSQSDKIDSDCPADNSDQLLAGDEASGQHDVFGGSIASDKQDSNERSDQFDTEAEIELKKELKNVVVGTKLGEGTFGEVFEGMYKPKLTPGESRIVTDVKNSLPPNMAVKIVHTDNDTKFIEKLRHECHLLKTINHDNIVKYYGFTDSDDQKTASIFMELMPHSLKTSYDNFGPMNEKILRRHTR